MSWVTIFVIVAVAVFAYVAVIDLRTKKALKEKKEKERAEKKKHGGKKKKKK